MLAFSAIGGVYVSLFFALFFWINGAAGGKSPCPSDESVFVEMFHAHRSALEAIKEQAVADYIAMCRVEPESTGDSQCGFSIDHNGSAYGQPAPLVEPYVALIDSLGDVQDWQVHAFRGKKGPVVSILVCRFGLSVSGHSYSFVWDMTPENVVPDRLYERVRTMEEKTGFGYGALKLDADWYLEYESS